MGEHTKKIVDELCNYLGYDFKDPMCKELHDHIMHCNECKEYIESVKVTVKLCQDCSKQEPVPQNVMKNLKSMLDKQRK